MNNITMTLVFSFIIVSCRSYQNSHSSFERQDSSSTVKNSNQKAMIDTSAITAGIPGETQRDIDWGWTNYGQPDNFCGQDEISSNPRITRGALNPRQCLEKAIATSKSGRDDLALRWIATIQCHNSRARQGILNGGIESVKYLMNKFGGGYRPNPSPNPPSGQQCQITINNKWTGGTLYIYRVMWREGTGTPTCEMMQNIGSFGRGQSKTETIPAGQNAWYKFKTGQSGPCGSSDVKYEINGIGPCNGTKQYDIN